MGSVTPASALTRTQTPTSASERWKVSAAGTTASQALTALGSGHQNRGESRPPKRQRTERCDPAEQGDQHITMPTVENGTRQNRGLLPDCQLIPSHVASRDCARSRLPTSDEQCAEQMWNVPTSANLPIAFSPFAQQLLPDAFSPFTSEFAGVPMDGLFGPFLPTAIQTPRMATNLFSEPSTQEHGHGQGVHNGTAGDPGYGWCRASASWPSNVANLYAPTG